MELVYVYSKINQQQTKRVNLSINKELYIRVNLSNISCMDKDANILKATKPYTEDLLKDQYAMQMLLK